MKKSFFTMLVLAILSTPFLVLSIIGIMRVKPEYQQSEPLAVEPITEPITDVPSQLLSPSKSPSKNFMNGYWDGWHGVWLGPIRWTVSDEYRQGNMLGSYDRRNKISRYPPPE